MRRRLSFLATATLVACAAGAPSVETSAPANDPERGDASSWPNLPPDGGADSDAVNPFCCNLDGIRHCGPFKCQ